MSVPSHPSTAIRFAVEAHASPDVASRLLQPFAKRGLVPREFVLMRRGDRLSVQIEIEGLAYAEAARIAGSMRQIVDVEAVLTAERDDAEAAAVAARIG
ncbi:MAG: hypothetical protein EXQ85_08670 [Alphaproteobacteria bacterium]|nr:hypothetical protein [Alphaproteobacteria bacterium]